MRLQGGLLALGALLLLLTAAGAVALWTYDHPLLFRLARHVRAAAVFDRLGQSGILVRRFDTEPDWLRFGVPGDGWDRLAAALSPG